MSLTEKQAFVDGFREKVQEAPVLYLTDFSGLDVKSMTLLRQRLRDSGAEYLVVKNRLVKRAVADLDMPDISEALLGPTGVVLGYEGVVEPAKVVSDFAKEHDDKPVFKLGILDKKIVSAVEIQRLAKLPPREQLLAELAGALEAPMAALVSALEGKIQEMAGLLDALREQKEGQGTQSSDAEAESGEAEAEAESADAEVESAEAEVESAEAEAEAESADAEVESADAKVESADAEAEAESADAEGEAPDAEAESAEAEAESAEAEAESPEAEAEPAEAEAESPDAAAELADADNEPPDPENEN